MNNGNNRNKVNKMEPAPTRHQPRRGVRNLANARAIEQARVPGPIRGTRKASKTQNVRPYARPAKHAKNTNSVNALPLNRLSLGSPFSMKRFRPTNAAKSYASNVAPSGFVPLHQQQAFQAQLNQNIAAQVAANKQHLANVSAHRSMGAKKAAATRKARKEAAVAALQGAMMEVQDAAAVVQEQNQSSRGVSNNAARALEHAERAAQQAHAEFQRALLDIDLNENSGSASAASAASANNLSSMFGRL